MNQIDISIIFPSPLNPRKNFDQVALEELAASIRQHGVLQPILVRIAPDGDGYEIIAGERRWRAAQIASLAEIPAMVIEADDATTVELMVIENLQRHDLTALEEAGSYRQLLDQHGYTPDTIADKIGRSRRYVFNRLQLLELPAPVLEHVASGALNPSVAVLLLQVAEKDLNEVLEQVLGSAAGNSFFDEPPLTVRQAQALIRRDYLTQLARAPWDIADADLLPAAGPCATCPSRTGAQPDLWGEDQSKDDACGDTACWRRKMEAHTERLTADAAARNIEVITGKKAEAFQEYGSGQYVALDMHPQADYTSTKTYEKHLGKAGLAKAGEVLLIGSDGVPRRAVNRKKAMDILAEKHDWAKRRQEMPKSSDTGAAAKRKIELKIHDATVELAVAALLPRAMATVPEGVWHLIAENAIRCAGYHEVRMVTERRKLTAGNQNQPEKALLKILREESSDGARALAVELFAHGSASYGLSLKGSPLAGFCELYGVDLDAISKEVKAQEKAKAKKAAPAKKPAKAAKSKEAR